MRSPEHTPAPAAAAKGDPLSKLAKHSPEPTEDGTPDVKYAVAIFSLCGLFVLIACLFVPYVGIQNDEALFAGPLYHDHPPDMRFRAFKRDVPLMLLSYLGTAKTLLYSGIFRIFHSGIWQLRIPVILIGAATIGVLALLFRKTAGNVAAVTACALLVLDPLFLLTTTFDWGPTALQHLTFGSALVLLIYACRNQSPLAAALGCFAAGFGMWDKALFVWMGSGAALAALLLYSRSLRCFLNRRMIGAGLLGFIIGASPLILYNIRQPLKTFQGNFKFAPSEAGRKAQFLKWCLSGAGLYGYIAGEEWMERPRPPRTELENLSVAVRQKAGERRLSIFFWVFAAAAASTPLWPRQRRAMTFALITMAVAWVQMAFNLETGGGVHHVVLLWPAPQFVVGAAVAGLADRLRVWAPRLARPAIAGLVLVFCGSNLLVLNQYFSQFVTMGAVGGWTDAIFPLARYLDQNARGIVFSADWGMVDGLVLLSEGRRNFGAADAVLMQDPAAEGTRKVLLWMLTQPSALFVTHTAKYEINTGVKQRLYDVAGSLGYEGRVEAFIDDSNGRQIFEVLRFTPVGKPASE